MMGVALGLWYAMFQMLSETATHTISCKQALLVGIPWLVQKRNWWSDLHGRWVLSF
jgi:hypothetical protein